MVGTVLSAPRLPVLAVTHIDHSKQNWVKRLACGVFNQAFRDSGLLRNQYSARIESRLQREAIYFLTSGGEAFRFWCHALNQDPDIVRSEVKKRLGG